MNALTFASAALLMLAALAGAILAAAGTIALIHDALSAIGGI